MLPDRVSNSGPLTYESGALPIALRGAANITLSLEKRQGAFISRGVYYDYYDMLLTMIF